MEEFNWIGLIGGSIAFFIGLYVIMNPVLLTIAVILVAGLWLFDGGFGDLWEILTFLGNVGLLLVFIVGGLWLFSDKKSKGGGSSKSGSSLAYPTTVTWTCMVKQPSGFIGDVVWEKAPNNSTYKDAEEYFKRFGEPLNQPQRSVD